MKLLEKCLRGAVGTLLRFLLGIYFRRIEVFHPERITLTGPLLLTSNHPGSVTDAFLIVLVHFGERFALPITFVITRRAGKNASAN